MTPLIKTTWRVTVAGLAVGDLIEIRPQGTRRRVRLSLFDAYRYAIRCQVSAIERHAKEIQKREGGRRATARNKARAEMEAA